MPTWSDILYEIASMGNDMARWDFVRRKYLTTLHLHTKRNTILYATNWTSPGLTFDPSFLTINDEDIQGLMEVVHGLKGDKLDLILHSPGGYPEATEAFVDYLRTRFNDVRVIIPYAAMSAATMLACSANSIVMGKHSFIGPIDPQFILQTQVGPQSVPAQAILDQFRLAKKECRDPNILNVWYPILGQYGPALIKQCEDAIKLSKTLVSKWLAQYMFKSRPDAKKISSQIAGYLSDHRKFKTHSRHIDRESVRSKGLIIEDLEIDQVFQDLVLSVFHATTHTMDATGTVKIIENHLGKAFVKRLFHDHGQQSPPEPETPA
jgi:hypothetical protein